MFYGSKGVNCKNSKARIGHERVCVSRLRCDTLLCSKRSRAALLRAPRELSSVASKLRWAQ